MAGSDSEDERDYDEDSEQGENTIPTVAASGGEDSQGTRTRQLVITISGNLANGDELTWHAKDDYAFKIKEFGHTEGERGGNANRLIIKNMKCIGYENGFPKALLLAPLRGDKSSFRGNVYGDNHSRGFLAMYSNHTSEKTVDVQFAGIGDDEQHILRTYGDTTSGKKLIQKIYNADTDSYDYIVPRDSAAAVLWGKNIEVMQQQASNGMDKANKADLSEMVRWYGKKNLMVPEKQWVKVQEKLDEIQKKLPWTSIEDFGFKLVNPSGRAWTDASSFEAVILNPDGSMSEQSADYVRNLSEANYVATVVLEISYIIHKGDGVASAHA